MTTAILEVLDVVKRAHAAWLDGDNEAALEGLNDALEKLVLGGQSPETMPGVFGLIHRIRNHLIENGAGA